MEFYPKAEREIEEENFAENQLTATAQKTRKDSDRGPKKTTGHTNIQSREEKGKDNRAHSRSDLTEIGR